MVQLTLKVKPEDFIVREKINACFGNSGGYSVFQLEKCGWNTIDLLKELARKMKIPLASFSYAGRKDRHGCTSQYISLQGNYPFNLKGRGYSATFQGFLERPIGPDLIIKNDFTIVVRKLHRDSIQSVLDELEIIKKIGYPNYFDDQRFGSFDQRSGFFAEKVLKKHYGGALKIHLTRVSTRDTKSERIRKDFFFHHWQKWAECLERAESWLEKKSFQYLMKHPRDFLPLLQQISKEEMSLYYACYQAHIWNITTKKFIQKFFKNSFRRYPGIVGDYVFYGNLQPEKQDFFLALILPTLGAKSNISDQLLREVYSETLAEFGMRSSLLNIRSLRQAFFKSIPRSISVIPENLFAQVFDDELYPQKKKLILSFSLPRGSYGTLLLKRVFSKAE